MHEYSIVEALLEQVEHEARRRQASAVHSLAVRIGELSGVEVDLLTTAYRTFRDRTICADAELMVTRVPAKWACSRCGVPIRQGDVLQCAVCAAPARLVEGDEILLDRIEMEVE
jgi:hydrogenase nickel incorporation protein HypA/HybF